MNTPLSPISPQKVFFYFKVVDFVDMPVPEAYVGGCFVKIAADKVFFTGGLIDNDPLIINDRTWIFDLNTLTWTESRPLPTGRSGSACGYLDATNEVMIVGGSEADGRSVSTSIIFSVEVTYETNIQSLHKAS